MLCPLMHSMWSPTQITFTPSTTLPSLMRCRGENGTWRQNVSDKYNSTTADVYAPHERGRNRGYDISSCAVREPTHLKPLESAEDKHHVLFHDCTVRLFISVGDFKRGKKGNNLWCKCVCFTSSEASVLYEVGTFRMSFASSLSQELVHLSRHLFFH